MDKEQPSLFDRKMLAYAIAGSTIVGGGSIAEAGVIRSGDINVSITTQNSTAFVDLDGDTAIDFILGLSEDDGIVGLGFAARGLDTGIVPGGTDMRGYVVDGTALYNGLTKDAAAKLSGGFVIEDTLASNAWSDPTLSSTVKIQTWNTGSGQPLAGNFAGVTEKYVGFRLHLSSNEDLVYGWLRFSVTAQIDANVADGDLVLHEWAYESTANTPITADSAAVPEPTSLAIFAMGGVGVAAWKRRRKAA